MSVEVNDLPRFVIKDDIKDLDSRVRADIKSWDDRESGGIMGALSPHAVPVLQKNPASSTKRITTNVG